MNGSFIDITMVLRYIILLTMVQIAEQYCGEHCVACFEHSCCLRCHAGFESDGCKCERCKNNCVDQVCLRGSATCGDRGCKYGWYGPRCDRSCSDCPTDTCDVIRDGCYVRSVNSTVTDKHEDGFTEFMEDKGKFIPLCVGIAMLLLSIAVGIYIYRHREWLSQRGVRTLQSPASQSMISAQQTNVTCSGYSYRSVGVIPRHAEPSAPPAEVSFSQYEIPPVPRHAEPSAPPAEVSFSQYEIPPVTVEDEPPPLYDSLYKQ